LDEDEVVTGKPVEVGSEAAEVLEPVEAAFVAIAELVDERILRDRGLA
jgi:hypothetical protein